MTQLKSRRPDPAQRVTSPTGGRRWTPWLVAALLALSLGTTALLVFRDSGSEPDVAQPDQTTTPTSVDTSVLTPTTTIAPIESPLADIPVWFGQVEAGTYQPSRFSVPFAFTLAEAGWEPGTDLDTKFDICGPDVEGPLGARSACFRASAVAVFLLDPDTVEDTQALLGTFPGADIGPSEPVSIDGAEGIRFSFTHDLIPHSNLQGGFGGIPFWQHEEQELPLGGDESVVTIVDVDGTVVTIVYQGRTVTDPAPFDAHRDEGLAIVDSIIWGL